MIAAVALLVIVLALRDHPLLQMGPRRTVKKRALYYLSGTCFMVAGCFGCSISRSCAALVDSHPTSIIAATGILQVALAVAFFVLRRADRHDLAWRAAVIPSPALAVLVFAATGAYESSVPMKLATAALPLAPIPLLVHTTLSRLSGPMSLSDLDFSVEVAAWSSAAIFCAALLVS